jgi:hypothetical protein
MPFPREISDHPHGPRSESDEQAADGPRTVLPSFPAINNQQLDDLGQKQVLILRHHRPTI